MASTLLTSSSIVVYISSCQVAVLTGIMQTQVHLRGVNRGTFSAHPGGEVRNGKNTDYRLY